MIFEHNDRTKELIARVEGFSRMDAHIYPNESTYHEQMDAFRAEGESPWMRVVPILKS